MVDYRIDVIVDPSRVPQGTRKVTRELTKVENRADAVRSSLGRMFGILAGGAVIASAVRTLAQFEQAIATVGAVTGKSGDALAEFSEKAQQLGISTRFTATEAADGLVQLSRAGFEANESLAAIGDTLLLAQAGGASLGQATSIAAATLRGFGIEARNMARVADVLTLASNSANTTVVELGEGMKLVAPIARGLNVSLEQTSAALGVLSDAGLKGTLAGTGLRRVMAELESPTAATADILQRFGITTDQVRVSQVGLSQALTLLRDAGIGAGEGLEIFGQRGGPAFAVLSENIPRVEEMTKVLNGAQGTAKRTATVMDDNLNGALLRVKSAFQGVILAVGQEGASGSLRGAVESLAKGLRFLAENADKLIVFVQNLALFLGPRYLLGAIKAITVAIAANPLGLLLTVIAAVAAAIPDLQGKITALVGTIGELASALLDGFDVTTLLQQVAVAIDTTVALFDGFLAAAGTVFDALKAQPKAAGEIIKKSFRDALEASLDFFLGFAQTVGNIILGIGEDFISLAANVGGAIGAISTGSLDAAQAYADNLESTLLRTANRVTTFNGQFASNLKKLNDVEILPEVQLSNEAFTLGQNVSAEFQRAFSESQPSAQEALDQLLAPQDELLAEAEKRAQEIQAAGVGETEAPAQAEAAQRPEKLGLQAEELLRSLDAQRQLTEQEALLNDVLKARPDLYNEINTELGNMQIAALEASTTMEDGFTRAFLKISQEAQDFASAAESAVNVFADNATDALTNFVETGQFSFKEFTSQLLKDITKIITRLLVMQAIQAAAGAISGGATTAGTVAAGARADGGTVHPDRSFLVGEEGPELFVPNRTGTIVPNQSQPQQQQPMTVQVVNVQSEDDIPNAIASGGADDAIINAIARNKDRVNQVTQ